MKHGVHVCMRPNYPVKNTDCIGICELFILVMGEGEENPFYFQSHTLAFHSQLQHVILLPCINLCNAPL